MKTAQAVRGRLSQKRGTILVYIVMLMVIFAVLGLAMVSLFSTSIGSSVTANDTRRATYLSEAGIRYAASELRAADFSKTSITNLNDTVYTVSAAGRFDLNIFSPWFESAAGELDGNTLPVNVPEGELPPGFLESLPAGNSALLLVNPDYFSLAAPPKPVPEAQSPINAFSQVTLTSLRIQLADDFAPTEKGLVALAVTPFAGVQNIPSQGFLDMNLAAKNIFPEAGGAFEVQRRNFYYMGVDPAVIDRVRLTGVTRILLPGESPAETSVAADDPVILTPLRNRLIVSEGSSGQVSFGKRINYAAAIVDYSPLPKSHQADIEFEEETNLESKLSQVEQGSNPDFITVDNTDKFLTIGGGGGPSLGAVWFRDTRSIGGQREFCNANGCFFKDGIRVFFTVEYTGSGDGFVFSLINGNPNKNDAASAGGDIERSEMLGYSGDSRLSVDGLPPPDPPFLDNSGTKRGLIPPKIGLEFDTKVNFSASATDCANATSLNANTRNDPGTPAAENRDAVQFVYWGANALDIPCREQPFCGSTPSCTGDPSYDDNRHNALFPNWNFNTNGAIQSSPALAADGTIYVGSNSTIFFAVNPDGTEKWRVDRSGAWFSPTVTSSGRIYVGTGPPDNQLYALNPGDGSNVGGFPFPAGGSVTTKPAAGTTGDSNGIVYFGSDDGKLYAVRSSGTPAWPPPRDTGFDTGAPVKSSPALSLNGNTVYFGSNNGNFYARHADNGAILWTASVGTAFQSSPAVGPNGAVYVGNDNGQLYAFIGLTGVPRPGFPFPTGAAVRSSPALSNDGSTVYVGNDNGVLFAVNTADGTEKWRFAGAAAGIVSPIAVDANDHIYFGSNDDNVYALYADGTEKWHFTTGGNVEVKPAVKADGTVYAGSRDSHLYSINQFTDPKNLKDLLITSSGLLPVRVGGVPVTMTSEEAKDWLKKGPWAVRIEITRTPSEPLVPGVYNLRAWIRQCNSANCDNPLLFDPLGTFFEDTRIQYAPTSPTPRPPMIEQTINLDSSNHTDFNRFLFGFTSQTASGETQTATIRKFQLSFIRSGDLTVSDDPGWPPP